MVDLGGYVIVLVEKNGKIKLFGSAAERNDCDEILEINGVMINDANHQEIVNFFTQCIKTRTICMRVKRKACHKLKIAAGSTLIDAFVIGSRAREHLQEITKDTNITPRDIAQISQILNEGAECEQNSEERQTKQTSDIDANVSVKHTKDNNTNQKLPLDSGRKLFTVELGKAQHRKLHQTDSGDIDYLEIANDNMQLLNLAPDPAIISKTDSQQSIVDLVKQSIGLNNTTRSGESGSRRTSSTLNVLDKCGIELNQITRTLQQVLDRLNDDNLNQLIEQTNLFSLLSVYEKAVEEVRFRKSRPAKEIVKLIQKVTTCLQHERLNCQESQELFDLLSKFEMEGLCSAFDQILKSRSNWPIEVKQQDYTNKSKQHQQLEQIETIVNVDKEATKQTSQDSSPLPPPVPPLPKNQSTFVDAASSSISPEIPPQMRPLSIGQMPEYRIINDFVAHSTIPPPPAFATIAQNNSFAVPSLYSMSANSYTIPPGISPGIPNTVPILPTLHPSAQAPLPIAVNVQGQSILSSAFVSPSPLLNSVSITPGPITPSPAALIDTNTQPSVQLPPNSKLSIVRIEKQSSEPLGATVRNEPDGRVTIGRIVCGGAAEKCAALQEGDELLMVNNVYIRGKDVNQVCELLAQMQGTLTFVIAKNDPKTGASNTTVSNQSGAVDTRLPSNATPGQSSNACKVTHYKAYFDYDPHQDVFIPCRELGIAFRKGNILHVLDSTDQSWWQAYREGDTLQNLAGLIPSLQFQTQRQQAARAQTEASSNQDSDEGDSSSFESRYSQSMLFNCGKKSAGKKRKQRKEDQKALDTIKWAPPYEELVLAAGHRRTLVLLGPNHIGRQQLRELLLNQRSSFAAPIPHTSRSRRSDEQDAVDYHFVSKAQFEQLIAEDKFIEFGEYDKSYYGTSFASVQTVISANRTCVLNLHVHSIHKLRTPEIGARLKPFFVMVSPPRSIDKLRKLIESINPMSISQLDLQDILDEAVSMEANYSQYFDLILPINDLDRACSTLISEIRSWDKDAQWMPASWIH